MPNKVILILIGLVIFLAFSLVSLAIYVTNFSKPEKPEKELTFTVSGEILEVSFKKDLLVIKTQKFNEFFIELSLSTLILDEANQPRTPDYLQQTFQILAQGTQVQENRLLAKKVQVLQAPQVIIFSPVKNMTVGEIIRIEGTSKLSKQKVPILILKENQVLWSDTIEIGSQNPQNYEPFSFEIYLPPDEFKEKMPVMLQLGNLTLPLIFKPQGFLTSYTHPTFRVSLAYPSLWKENLNYGKVAGLPVYYQGLDGFFTIQAGGSQETNLQAIAQQEISHRLRPYGSNPTLEDIFVAGKKAKLILPSLDQSPDLKQQSAIIAEYPLPVKIDSEFYHYFILYASKDHILKLAKTLKFLDAPTNKVKLYLSNNILDPTDTCNKVFAVLRDVIETPELIENTINLLLQGPTPKEKEAGYFSNLPSSVKLSNISLQEGNLEIALEGLDLKDQNSCQAIAIKAQFENTLAQFSEIKKAQILVDNKRYFEFIFNPKK